VKTKLKEGERGGLFEIHEPHREVKKGALQEKEKDEHGRKRVVKIELW